MITFVSEESFDPCKYHPEGVLYQIKHSCNQLPCGSIVAIDGWPASGKSPTAIWLGRTLGWKVIHLDDFTLRQRRGLSLEGESSWFDEVAMSYAVRKEISRNSVVVEGVCAARVCDPSILIHLGSWPGHGW